MNNKLFIYKSCLLALLVAPSVVSAAAVAVADDFSSSTIDADNRLRVRDTDSDWLQFSGSSSATNPLDAGEWAITGGALTNPGTTSGTASQSPIFNLLDVGDLGLDNYTQLTISFDYNVAADTTLTFYSYGYFNGTLTPTSQLHNTGTSNGSIQSQYDAGGNNGGDFSALNLLNGDDTPNGTVSTGEALTGSGNFSVVIDLTAPGYEEVANVNDLQLISSGFRGSGGAISIDNFEISVDVIPEPSSTALLGLGSLTLLLRRRKA